MNSAFRLPYYIIYFLHLKKQSGNCFSDLKIVSRANPRTSYTPSIDYEKSDLQLIVAQYLLMCCVP